MRRYQLTVNNNAYEIDVEEISVGEYEVFIDGQLVEVNLTSQADTGQAVITPEIEVAAAREGSQQAPAATLPTAPKVSETVRAATPRTPSPAVAGGTDLAYSMSAPMPGVILEINVAAGASVNKGDVVMVLEAMKMKNDLHASRTGVVESVDVQQGDQVKYGQVLLRFAKD